MTPSDSILRDNAAVWEQMLGHRFVRDVCADRLPEAVFHRYLRYEGAFVETAIGIFAYATARAPDVAAKRWLIGVQQALANDQLRYFEKTFAALGIAPLAQLPEQAADFDGGMLEIAERGSFAEIVTAMFAAEWLYATWCRRAAGGGIADPHLRRWVELHAEEAFTRQAEWLKAAVDASAETADAADLSRIFGRVIALEIAFHSAAYDPAEEAGPQAGGPGEGGR